jgi:LPS-assembly protein
VIRFRYFWCITLFLLCHAQTHSLVLTNALPQKSTQSTAQESQHPSPVPDPIPDDPSRQLLPIAKPEPIPLTGVPVRAEALQQTHSGDITTLTGEVVFYYKNYVIHADKVLYHQDTATVEAEGHIQVEGGPNDAVFTASHGETHLEDHTAKFFDVIGTFGVRRMGATRIYTTPDPFIFKGRILLQTGEKSYRIVDGSMTSCRLPKPDWEMVSRSIQVTEGKATTHNSVFEFLRIPLFYLPFVARNLDESGRESGILIPSGANSGVKGLVIGEQVYWAINRTTDMTVGAEYWSKRGYAPNGDFRYRGRDLDGVTIRWNGLFDRGIHEILPGDTTPTLINQGGADILAYGRKDFSPNTRVAGNVEYLSSYIYRLAFDENLAQATSSEVQSDIAFTHNFRGFVPSVSLDRFQSFAGSTGTDGGPVISVPEVRVLHLPNVRFDALDRPLAGISRNWPPLYWGLGSSIADLDRAEPDFHARNVGRLDIYPHAEWPLHLARFDIVPAFALRSTQYSGSQIPDILGLNNGIPTVSHVPLNRSDVEASIDIRMPALERDFSLNRSNRTLRHVIEPELFYRYVTGVHNAQQTLHFDTTDIATNTNEAGYSLTQRFYLKRNQEVPCENSSPPAPAHHASADSDPGAAENPTHAQTQAAAPGCTPPAREWASWQVTQKFFFDPNFGGALLPNRRNVFDSTLDLTGVAYLTESRSISPIISRLRFEAIDRLRIEWDFDYDTKAGRVNADNIFAGYSMGRTTVGVGHALLNAADEMGSAASIIKSEQVKPFLYFGKPSDPGFSVGMNASWDFTHDALQYGSVEAVYNWNCCGLNLGYRRFALGTLRDESEWLWGFTLAGIGTAGNIHRTTAVFPTAENLRLSY